MKTDPSNSETVSRKVASPYFQIFVLTLATFMSLLDSTVANVALPKMAGDLSAAPNEIVWVIVAYLVALAAVLPISGWLATYFGRKRYYMACVTGFIISSMLCGLATNLESLVFFRVLQGLSAGGIAPSEQAIIADITPKDKLGRAFSIYGLGISVAPILGPTFGGFITDTFSWHWIFFINLPVGIVSLFLTALFVHETPQAEKASRKLRESGKSVDWLGILLFVSGIAALEVVLQKGAEESWFDSDFIVIAASYSFLALLIGVTWEYYRKNPAVDIMMFRDRTFTGAVILIFVTSFVLTGTGFLIPFMTQTLLGYSAMDAGMISLPGTIIQLIMIQTIGFLSDKFDIRKIIMFGLIFSMMAVWNLASFNLDVSYTDLVTARAFQLFALAFLAVTMNAAAYYHIPPEKNNSASALLNLAVNMGASIGVAVTSTILVLRTQVHINNLGYHASNLNPNFTMAIDKLSRTFHFQGLTESQADGAALGVMWQTILRQATMNGIIDSFNFYLILYLCVIPLVFLLKKKKSGANPTGH